MVKSKRSWSFHQKATKSKVVRNVNGENIDLELGPIVTRSLSCPTGEIELPR